MPAVLAAVTDLAWDLLTAAGGTLALSFIVALAVGMNALTLLFVGSAVVALERFARVARSGRNALACGLVAAGLAALLALRVAAPEPGQAGGPGPGAAVAGAAAGVALAMGLVALALRLVSGERLALACAGWLGLGYALGVAGSGRPGLAAAPAAVALACALALRVRRRRCSPPRAAGLGERMLLALGAAFLAGVAVAAVLPGATPGVSAAGGALLGLFGALVLFGLAPLAAAGLLGARRSVEWFVAVRYLVAKRRQTFISAITAICVVGIAAGVWLIITVLSVMNGFERTWRDEIIGNRAHFTVHSGLGPFADYATVLEQVEGVPDVVAASPYLDAEGMVRGSAGQIMAVRVRGVDPARVGSVTDLRDDLKQGSLEDLAPGAGGPSADPGIAIGSQLAGALALGLGDPVLLISPFGGPQTPLGPAPRLMRFRVVGIFESSFFQYDEMFTYVSLAAAQDFRRSPDVVDGIEARTSDFYRSRRVADAVERALGFPYYTRDWKEFFPAFFQALKSERVMMFILLTMIMVVAAFSIASTLVMMIMEKSSDIAILKAMGAQDDSIERIFAIEGALIGLAGTALGVLAGVAVTGQIAWVQRQVEAITGIDTLPASVYQFSTLPAELDLGQIAASVGIAMVLSLGATLLPSRQGARMDPVEALRYE
jgi:lipoprotein-releasing system permease protein